MSYLKRSLAVCGVAIALLGQDLLSSEAGFAEAATLDFVVVDRATALLTGTTNIFPGSPSGFSVLTFGPTMVDSQTSNSFSASATFDGTSGTIDFFDMGFPPASFAGGVIQDVDFAPGLLSVLFLDAATADLFLFEVTNADLPAAGIFSLPVFAASSAVFAATEIASTVPLPATGVLLAGAIGLAGLLNFKRGRS